MNCYSMTIWGSSLLMLTKCYDGRIKNNKVLNMSRFLVQKVFLDRENQRFYIAFWHLSKSWTTPTLNNLA